jgi:hypothetical protein
MLLISSQLQLIGIWLTRCNFVFNKHVWSDEVHSKENLETITGTESYIQKFGDGKDDKVASFPRDTNLRTFEENKLLKMCSWEPLVGHLGYGNSLVL